MLALYDFTSFYWATGKHFNAYEFYHYYLGAKYAPELGYAGLYRATFVADVENGNSAKGLEHSRSGYAAVGSGRGGAEGEGRDHEPGPESRWTEFRHDVAFFRKALGTGLFNRVLTDKGYNATPVWGVLAA